MIPPAALRNLVLFAAGTMPVLSIPLFVLGVVTMHEAAVYVVVPLAVVAAVLILRRTPESRWAGRGLVAGLVAVAAYDAVRMPLVFTDVWPDFIPRLGGWITDTPGDNVLVGYLWRYLGDGGGIGLAFFVVCGLAATVRPRLVSARPVALSIGYGVFIWSGLITTVAFLPGGAEHLFALSPLSFVLSLLGHLIYGGVLGLFLRAVVRRDVTTSPVVVRLPRQKTAVNADRVAA